MSPANQVRVRGGRKKQTSHRTKNFAENDPPFISISGLFDDFWLPTFFWIDISAIKELTVNVYLPPDQKVENHKTAIVLVGTRLQLVSIARGEVTKISIQPLDTANSRIGFDVPSAELAPQGDERKLGMKLISIEFNDKNLLPADLFRFQQNNITAAAV